MSARRILLRVLAGALCIALVGCSGEPTETPEAQATPNATASVAEETTQNPDAPEAATSANDGKSSEVSRSGFTDSRVLQTIKKDPEKRNGLTQMKVEPGTERYFQNGLNDAELAYRKARNEKKQKARREAAEQRRSDVKSGNGAPVFEGGELTQINAP